MMTIAKKPNHHCYSIISIEEDSYYDIRNRLEELNVLWKYLGKDDYDEEIIIFGAIAFKKEYSVF